jgi:hypothetical protein
MTKDRTMTSDTQGDHNGYQRLRAELLTASNGLQNARRPRVAQELRLESDQGDQSA